MKTKCFEIRLEFPTRQRVDKLVKDFPFKPTNQLLKDSILKGEKLKGSLVKDGVCAVLYIHPLDECIERTGGFNRNIPMLTKMTQQFTELFPDLLSVEVYGYSDKPEAECSFVIWNWHYVIKTQTALQCELPETLQYHFSVRQDKPSHASRALLDFLIRNHDKTAGQLLRYH